MFHCEKNRSYSLRLGNNAEWCFIPTIHTFQWVETLASIMELETYNGQNHRKIVFVRDELKREGIQEEVIKKYFPDVQESSSNGSLWRFRNIQGIKFLSSLDLSRTLCDIGLEQNAAKEIRKMRYSLQPIYAQIQGEGGLPFHGALIEKEGKGVILSAPSGTGKSTCCERLPESWIIHSDDESLMINQGGIAYRIHPLPSWKERMFGLSERTWTTHCHVPLAAFFFIEQSEKDEVIQLKPAVAAVMINASSSSRWYNPAPDQEVHEKRGFQNQFFDNVCNVSRVIPSFKLGVTLHGHFWNNIEKVLL